MRLPNRLVVLVLACAALGACKRNDDPPPDLIKTQRDAMDKAKGVGETMQKGVDAQGRKADEEGK